MPVDALRIEAARSTQRAHQNRGVASRRRHPPLRGWPAAMAAMGNASMAAAMRLQAAAASTSPSSPPYFRSQKERKFFRTYGKWQTEERRCDKFIRNRAYDKTCQQIDPKPYELLPLLVTGALGSGTRASSSWSTPCATKLPESVGNIPEFNVSMDAAVVLQPHGSPRPPRGHAAHHLQNPCCESATNRTATWLRSVACTP